MYKEASDALIIDDAPAMNTLAMREFPIAKYF